MGAKEKIIKLNYLKQIYGKKINVILKNTG